MALTEYNLDAVVKLLEVSQELRARVASIVANWGEDVPALDRGGRETRIHVGEDGKFMIEGLDGNLYLMEGPYAMGAILSWQDAHPPIARIEELDED